MRGFNLKRTWTLVSAALLIALITALILPATVFAQQDRPPSALTPGSPAAAAIANLHSIVLIVAVVIFVIVEGLLLFSAWRFRRKPNDTGEPVQIHGNNRLEIAWTIAPALVVVGLFALAIQTQRDIDASSVAAPVPGVSVDVEVVGHRWWWEFRYPNLGITTAGELVIPAGRVVNLKITAIDVIHSFWVPELGGKTDAIPNVVNTSFVRADQPGRYYGQCAELCGVSHASMRFVVTALSSDEFDTWAARQVRNYAPPTEALAQTGEQLFTTAGCVGCHTIRGKQGAAGQTGPDLTHVTSRPYIASGILANTPLNQSRWLADPPGLKPGALMPNLNLSKTDIEALVAFLQTLK
jgi:cytochrome c oxidase subunit 2